MKALVVDDLRTIAFPAEYTEVIHARTVEHGVVELLKGHVDVLVLDHDLGGEATIKPLVAVVESLTAQGKALSIGEIYIVSSNPYGQSLRECLARLGYPCLSGTGPGWLDIEETERWNDAAELIRQVMNPYEFILAGNSR